MLKGESSGGGVRQLYDHGYGQREGSKLFERGINDTVVFRNIRTRLRVRSEYLS